MARVLFGVSELSRHNFPRFVTMTASSRLVLLISSVSSVAACFGAFHLLRQLFKSVRFKDRRTDTVKDLPVTIRPVHAHTRRIFALQLEAASAAYLPLVSYV